MYTRAQLIDSIRHETEIIKHLLTKLPEGKLDYRPTEGQRSMEELLRYLTVGATTPAAYIRDGNWDAAIGFKEKSEKLDLANFNAAMDEQVAALESFIGGFTDDELLNRDTTMPWGNTCKTGAGIVDMCLKTLVAYRMQLFLYIKAAGNSEISSANCWVGRDMTPPAE